MRRTTWAALSAAVVIAALGLGASPGQAREVPALVHRVTDLAQLLPAPQRADIEARLKAYEMRTGRQFSLLIVPSLDDEPIDLYSMRVAEAWKLGRKPQEDGLLLLIAVQERRMRIEVGYGLEADITDILSSRIVHNVLRPAFRNKTYGEGIVRAFDVLMSAADKSPTEGLLPQEGADDLDDATKVKIGFWLVLIIIILLVVGPRAGFDILLLLASGLGDNDRRGGSGGDDSFTGGGGGFGGGGASGDW